jgi:hypothetical protein
MFITLTLEACNNYIPGVILLNLRVALAVISLVMDRKLSSDKTGHKHECPLGYIYTETHQRPKGLTKQRTVA